MGVTAVPLNSIGIIGGGAWGRALGQTRQQAGTGGVLRQAGRGVVLWARESEVVEEINVQHRNTPFLPDVALDTGLRATSNLAEIAAQAVVLMVAPAQHVRAVASELARHLPAGTPV